MPCQVVTALWLKQRLFCNACFATFLKKQGSSTRSCKFRVACLQFCNWTEQLHPSTTVKWQTPWTVHECRTRIKQAFRSYFFTNDDVMQYFHISQAVLGMISLTLRLLWLLDTQALHFNSSALNQHQSGFWRLCEYLTYPFVIRMLSDAVMWSM